jgi:predicted GNAT family N-acyltransferase
MELREFSPVSDGLLQKIGRLRVEAWKTETSQAAEMETWVDDFDPSARHWAVFENGVLLASARLTTHSSLAEVPDAESYLGVFRDPPAAPIGSLNRLVVHPSARGRGLSKRLDLIRIEAAEKMGCRSVILSTASGPHRVHQLIGWGFEMAGYGPRFLKPPLCYLPPPAVLVCRLPRLAPTAAADLAKIPAIAAAPPARYGLGD